MWSFLLSQSFKAGVSPGSLIFYPWQDEEGRLKKVHIRHYLIIVKEMLIWHGANSHSIHVDISKHPQPSVFPSSSVGGAIQKKCFSSSEKPSEILEPPRNFRFGESPLPPLAKRSKKYHFFMRTSLRNGWGPPFWWKYLRNPISFMIKPFWIG